MARRRRMPTRSLQVEQLEAKLLLAADLMADAAEGQGIGAFASDEAYAAWLLDAAVERWQGLFGTHAYPQWPVILHDHVFFEDAGASLGDEPFPVALPMESGGVDASSTNTQVAGVDEADLVETDGGRVFALGGGRLSIVGGIDTAPELLGKFDLPRREQAVGMFLDGNRLTVLTTASGSGIPEPWLPIQSHFWSRFTTSPHATITVLDVADSSAVRVVSSTRVDGELLASRMVDGQLRLVINQRFEPPMPEVVPLPDANTPLPTVVAIGGEVGTARHSAWLALPEWRWLPEGTYESEASYVARVRGELVASMRPQVYRLDASGVVTNVANLVPATAIDIPEQNFFQQLTTVAAVDVAESEPTVSSVGLLTSGQTEVFADGSSVYVFDSHAEMLTPPGMPVIADWPAIAVWMPPVTDVARIDVAGIAGGEPAVTLRALGSFEGTLLNRFAVGEQDGFLRAVVQQRADGHGVVVLEPQGDTLEVVGSLGGIAADEQLYAARIVDDRAYFVTFRFTDPLFVVDLSTPTAPELLGELHVPGYADHLQPLEGDLLLAIGRDADERSGMFLGLQLSLFDVRTPETPTLLHRYTFDGGRTTSTPITGNRWQRGDGDPLAMGFFPEWAVVAIPVTSEGSPWWWDEPISVLPEPWPGGLRIDVVGSAMLPPPPKQTLEVIRFDVAHGITPLGSIDHQESIQRSLRVGERLVAVSASELSVHDFADPSLTLASVALDDWPHVAVDERPLGFEATHLAGLLEQGFPLLGAWAVQAMETTATEEIAYATHASGAVHRLSRMLGDDAWAGFSFDHVGNLESLWLDPASRGRAAPLPLSGEPAAVAQLVSDAVLEKLGLVRDADGTIRRAAVGDNAAVSG